MRIAAHGGDPGRIDVAIDPAGEGWQVTIRDNGIGIPPEDLQKIFDPFFTSKDVGKGMGLGLSITHQILQAHKAIVEVDSRPAEFTRFRIAFPTPSLTRSRTGIRSRPTRLTLSLSTPSKYPTTHLSIDHHEQRDRRLRLPALRHPFRG